MKRIFIIVLGLCSLQSVFAQDHIVLKNNEVIKAKVISIQTDSILYKKWGDLEGPSISLKKNKIAGILYENGNTDNWSKDIEETRESVNKTYEQMCQDIENLKKISYRSGKLMKNWGIAITSISGLGVLTSLIGTCTTRHEAYIYTLVFDSAVLAGGIVLIAEGRMRMRSSMASVPVFSKTFQMGDVALTPSVNVFNDTNTHSMGFGAGFQVRF